MKKVIGITGSIGSGKSTVAKKIAELGYQVIDCDKISHQMLNKNRVGYKRVIEEFGTDILDESLHIDRKKLGSLVFGNTERRTILNQILHPLIRVSVEKEISKVKEGLVFMECPLLFETDFYKLCDASIVVYVDMDTQIRRIMTRDKTDFPTTLKKIYSQMPLDEKMCKADYVIDNCHSEYDLGWQIKQIIKKLKEC